MNHKLIPLTLCALALVGFAASASAGNTSWDSNAGHWSQYKRTPAPPPPPISNQPIAQESNMLMAEYLHEVKDLPQTEPASGYSQKYYGKHENNARYND